MALRFESIWGAAVALLLLFAPLAACAETEDGPKTVEEAVDGFYVALNAMFTGDLEPMKVAWSHADDVTYMGPAGGFRVGWAAVEADWQSQADLKLGGRVEPTDIHIVQGPEIAIVKNRERGENVGPDGQPTLVSLRASLVLRNEDSVWKVIGHQTDLLPLLSEQPR